MPARLVAVFALLAVTASTHPAQAQTLLTVGDLQITGVTADGNNSITFVLWKDITAGTVIHFMDHSFASTAGDTVNGTESHMSLTFTAPLSAGTVIHVEHLAETLVNGGTFSGTKSGSLSGVSVDGDQVFAYQGPVVSDTSFTGTLLYGINIAGSNWRTTGFMNASNSYLPTAISGVDANLDTGNFDNVDYAGTRTGLTVAAYRAAISSLTNYTQSDTRFALATGGFTTQDRARLHWDANGLTTGNGGSGTWDATTQDRFKNDAAGSTYLRWVNSAAGSEHVAVFGDTAGTVTIASGGVTASGVEFTASGYAITGAALTFFGEAPTISIPTAGHVATIQAPLSGANGFRKTGDGTLILSGTSNVTGRTTIDAGGVMVHGSLGTTEVTVAAGAKLGGTGSLGGRVILQGGTLAPGNDGIGTITLGGADFAPAGVLQVEIADFAGTAGTHWDRILSSGTLTISATNAAPFRIELISPGLAANFQDGVASSTILGSFNTITGFDPGKFVVDTSAFANSFGGSFSVATTGGNLVLNYTPAPEPHHMLGLAALVLGLGRRVSRSATARPSRLRACPPGS